MTDCRQKALDSGLLWLRLLTGVSIAYVGYGKVFGGQVAQLQQGLAAWGFPAPALFAWAAALSEFAGGIFIAVGFLTRGAALFLFVTMCVAFFKAHAADPFSVKMPAFLYGAIASALVLTGAGRFSVDGFWCCKSCKTEPVEGQPR